MKVRLRNVLGGCLFVMAAGTAPLFAQEGEAEGADVSAIATDDGDAALGTASAVDSNRWRYKQHEGRWWYWLPSNRWVVWSEGAWIDPPTHAIESESADGFQHEAAPTYVVPRPSPAARLLQPRPRSWYFTGRTYDGPYYYYDEFYEPYGGARPHPYYPDPRPYARRPNNYGRYPYYSQPGVGVSIGGGSSVRFGVGF